MQTDGETSFSSKANMTPNKPRASHPTPSTKVANSGPLETKIVQALEKPVNPFQERAVLDLLAEAIIVVSESTSRRNDQDRCVSYANRAFENLLGDDGPNPVDTPLTTLFPPRQYPKFHDALERTYQTNEGQELDLILKGRGVRKHLSLSLLPYDGPSFKDINSCPENEETRQIVCCIRDTTDAHKRATYLEDRAMKLIDHAQALEVSRLDLEKQLLGLRKEVSSFERVGRVDPISGLPNRVYFLERGSGEFQRSLRYGHTLSVVVCAVQGYRQMVKQHGQEVGDAAITRLGLMCEAACRAGTDIGGRTADDEIAILLPETDLMGAFQFVERLKESVSTTTIETPTGNIPLEVLTGVDEIKADDHAFLQCLVRAHNTCPPNL